MPEIKNVATPISMNAVKFVALIAAAVYARQNVVDQQTRNAVFASLAVVGAAVIWDSIDLKHVPIEKRRYGPTAAEIDKTQPKDAGGMYKTRLDFEENKRSIMYPPTKNLSWKDKGLEKGSDFLGLKMEANPAYLLDDSPAAIYYGRHNRMVNYEIHPEIDRLEYFQTY